LHAVCGLLLARKLCLSGDALARQFTIQLCRFWLFWRLLPPLVDLDLTLSSLLSGACCSC
jgi:hypothetical protein